MSDWHPAAVVYVVDDDAAIRQAMQWLVQSLRVPVRAFASGSDFLAEYPHDSPGCLVVDMFMPGMSGMEVLDRLLRAREPLPVVFTSAFVDVPMAVDAIKRGAVDFLQKPFANAAFLASVRTALSKDAEQRRQREMLEQAPDRLAALTPRERDVLQLVVSGKTNKIIGRALDISYKTVEAHRSRLMRKLNVSCLAELIQLCLMQEAGRQGGGAREQGERINAGG